MVAYHPFSLPIYTYVAFGSQGLPAMLPVLLPTLVIALGIMVFASFGGTQTRRRKAQSLSAAEPALKKSSSPARDPRNPAADGPSELDLKIERKLGGFHLDIQWSPRRRRLAILGPSGSGKSMTLKIIAGIEPCDVGDVIVNGNDISRLPPAARGIAYVPQNYGLFPNLTVAEQLKFPADADADAAKRWIERFGLRGLEQRHPDELSLGQQQRVALARALVRPAQLLLLDEPFSALDAPLRSRLRQEMFALQQELTATTILVTHDPAEAALLADEILLLEDGRVLQADPTGRIFSRPASETAARLLGAETAAEGVAVDPETIAIGAGVSLKVAGPPLQPSSSVGWAVPAARVRLTKMGRYQGQIESIVPLGAERRIAIRFGKAVVHALTGYDDRSSSSLCRFDIDPDAVRVWPLYASGSREGAAKPDPAPAPGTVELYAAGSLRAALTDAAKAFEAKTGHRVQTKFGPSGLLKDEIANGAKAGVFASANMEHPQALNAANKSGPVLLFVRNKLCALVRHGLATDGATLLDRMLDPSIKLGTSTPQADPSGDYAFELFRKAEAINPGARATLEGKALKLTGDATSALPPPNTAIYGWHIAEGRADIFLCYRTAAAEAQKQYPDQQIITLPDTLAVGADYGLTVISAAPPAAQSFAEFIISAAGQDILTGHGFAPGQSER
jgi:ABC-type Fe3+/spermidine/putrescine transport system ATPase subunit/ABC-type molybdate transport system substrate-binding protein